MIPYCLQVQNFMAYGENLPEINFEGLDLVCLAGQNGAGKSTLLEAITWVLWGKSRAKSDDDLVRHGKGEMSVIFEFEVEGNKYRIIRKRNKEKRGHGQLEFFIFQNEDWQPLSGTSKNETQKKVVDTLHLSYETFINSAFLRQGHADEFTVKRPQERKAILTDILGLEKYNLLQEKAKGKVKIKEIELEGLNNLINAFEEETKDKKTLESDLEEKERVFKKFSLEASKKEAEASSLREKKYLLENQEKIILDFGKKVSEEKQEIKIFESEIVERESTLLFLEKLFSRRKEIFDGFDDFERLKKEEEKQYQIFITQQKLLGEKNIIERRILMSEKKKENEIAEISGRINDREQKISKKSEIIQDGVNLKKEYAFFEKKEEEKKNIEEKLQNQKEALVKIEETIRHLQIQQKETQENIKLIAHAVANCPLCQQSLSTDHKEKLESKLEKELEAAKRDIVDQQNQRQKASSLISELKREFLKLEGALLKKATIFDRLTLKRQEYKNILILEEELADLRAKKSGLLKADGGTVEADKVKLEKVEGELRRDKYDESAYKEIQAKRREKEKYQELKVKFEEAERSKIFEERQLQIKKDLLIKKKEALCRDEAQYKKTVFDPGKLEKIKRELEKASIALEESRGRMMEAKEGFGIARERLEKIGLKEREISDKKKKISSVQKETEIYSEIAEAFGKKGIQTMIIESILPEIEEEANNLLAKMTEGRMRIEIITQKEKKSEDGIQETLDIQITDGEEMRPYEMFSGGEAFRINFAIRIALSKLLTRRAGAKLQFLVVDEGFGTQDSTGKEYVINAINSICGEFKKILIITHIPEIKDAFSARIEVSKGENGSTFEIVHAS